MKLVTAVLVLLFTLNIFFTPSSSFAQDEKVEAVDIYAVFWPVVPGTTVADSMFWAKQLKEGFSGFFTFGEINQSKYQIELSEKRLVESAKLVENKDYSNALKSLNLNKSHRSQAVELKRKALEKNEDVSELAVGLVESLQDQQKALGFLASQFPEDQRNDVQTMADELTFQISEAK